MHASSQLLLDRSKGCPHTIASCLALELKGPTPRVTANMDEPQKGEGFRFAKSLSLSPNRRMAAKLQQPGLASVQLQRKALKPLAHCVPESSCIGFLLETRHDIIGIAHDDDVSGGFAPAPLHHPEIENVMQIDVGQQR